MEKATDQPEYLCQVSETVSCGNCCGLYNVKDPSYEALEEMLAYRSRIFRQTPRNMDDILAYKDHIRQRESRERPVLDFHHCPYLGLLGNHQSRVGCLLHPEAEGNRGIDLRGLSFYGGLTCNMYFCPSARNLPAHYAKIVKAFTENWHQYGLIITETRLLVEFFKEVEHRINGPVFLERFLGHPDLIAPVVDFFRLKTGWPFRPAHHAYPTNDFFNDGIYPKPEVEYPPDRGEQSRYNGLFRELVSRFTSQGELLRAEKLLDDIFSRFHGAVARTDG
jgi:hypothetical protein